MCFSASASFAASAVLAGAGAATLRRAWGTPRALFASMPLLFAAQQAIEGALWLALARAPYHRTSSALVHAFLLFALGLWPGFIPLATSRMEPDPRRRRAMLALAAGGFALGAYLMTCALVRPAYSCLTLQRHVYYGVQVDGAFKPFLNAVYLALVTAPLCLSSVRGTGWFAAASVASFAAAALFFRVAFASVWCFFAAVLSLAVYRIAAPALARAGEPAGGREPRAAQAGVELARLTRR